MGNSIDVNSRNFPSEVIEKSYEKPVLVDFFATWCGPCQILKPILESLAKEYDFILAKVDIDANTELASRYGVEGVPDVKIVTEGKVSPGFVGVLPEPQLRELLAKLNLKSDLELGLEEAKKAIAGGNAKAAKQVFDRLFAQFPNNPLVAIDAARFLIHLNKLEKAGELLDSVGFENQEHFQKAQSFKALIGFKEEANQPENTQLGRKYAKACRLALEEKYEASLQLLLEVVEADRKYKNDGARKAMTSIFAILGSQHPLTKKYQPELMMTLY